MGVCEQFCRLDRAEPSRPNDAVDCIITRFKRSGNGSIVYRSGKPLLEYLSIYREAEKIWAIPGSLVSRHCYE
jgi:hypothetical protein